MNIVNSVKNTILDNVKALRTGIKNFLTEEQNLPDDAPRKLRGKQTEVFEALLKPEFSDEDIARGYFKLPTGFGKTVMFAHLTKSFLNETSDSKKKILVLVPRINLLEQTDEKFDKFIGVDTSYFYAKEKDTSSRVIISTYQSLSNLLKNINKEDIDLVIADEAHHALGENTSKLFKDLQKYAPTIAFTATPNYSNDKKLANLFSKEIYSMTTIDAVQNNMLVPVKNILLRSSIEFDLSQVKKKNDGNFDYEKIASSISMDTLSKEIAKAYLYGEDKDEEGNSFRFFGKKAMISCPNVKTAIAQAEKINELAGQVIARPVFQHMNMKPFNLGKFDETVEDFKNNKFLVACQVNTLTEGFDDTGVSISINYPTASAVREEQSAGRALRINEKDPNKVAYVIDTVFFVGNDDENPFETAQKAGQVLFSDVAGASVIFPKNFKHKKGENDRGEKDKEGFPIPPPDIEIPEFKIFTDTETLLQVFNNNKIPHKTEDWYSSEDLNDLLCGGSKKYAGYLKQAVKMPEFKDTVKLMKSGSNEALFLHKDGLKLFKETFGIKEIKRDLPEKTEDWYSNGDLANKEKVGLIGSPKKHKENLEKAINMPKFKDKVKLMKSGSHEALCIRKDALDLFKKEFYGDLPQKTEDWYSNRDLGDKEKVKLIGSLKKHKENLEKAINMPKFKDKVKLMKSGSYETLCIHKDALDLFKKEFYENLPEKTEDWYSSEDLDNLLVGGSKKYADYLNQAVKMPEFENTVKLMQSGSLQPLCLHKDGLIDFVQTFKIKIRDPEMFEKAIKKIEQKIAMEEEVQKTKNAISKTIPDGKEER